MAEGNYDEGTVVERVAALVRDWADGAEENFGEGVEVGAVAVVYEVKWPDGGSGVAYSSSDPRPWVQSALFRRVMLQADALSEGDE
jgi:hypothetical protein